MIGARRAAGLAERLGQFLGRRARLGIDDPGPGLFGDQVGDLARRIVLAALIA